MRSRWNSATQHDTNSTEEAAETTRDRVRQLGTAGGVERRLQNLKGSQDPMDIRTHAGRDPIPVVTILLYSIKPDLASAGGCAAASAAGRAFSVHPNPMLGATTFISHWFIAVHPVGIRPVGSHRRIGELSPPEWCTRGSPA